MVKITLTIEMSVTALALVIWIVAKAIHSAMQ
jgi:hypothetical protein